MRSLCTRMKSAKREAEKVIVHGTDRESCANLRDAAQKMRPALRLVPINRVRELVRRAEDRLRQACDPTVSESDRDAQIQRAAEEIRDAAEEWLTTTGKFVVVSDDGEVVVLPAEVVPKKPGGIW